jgi:hypothetical protein
VIDVFYKLQALHGLGVLIHLHCFNYGRGREPELEKYCASVDYYERFVGHKGISNIIPYIVASRRNEPLLQRLLLDDHPILMEGIHCTYLLLDARFSSRKCFIRLHNVEYSYYDQLRKAGSSLLKKIYYWMESRLLKSYEKKICNRASCWAISETDRELYKTILGCRDVEYLPAFIPFTNLAAQEGVGTYCLYHGDLSIDANEKAALWLQKKVFNRLPVPFIIAGKGASEQLAKQVAGHSNTCLVSNPSPAEMQDLVEKAHIHVLPSYTSTGTKLKLVNALFNGRHCIVNDETVAGTGLEALCHTGTTANAFRDLIAQLYHQPFGIEEIKMRQQLLVPQFDNKANAEKIIRWIWNS